jgi:hypothetical protein
MDEQRIRWPSIDMLVIILSLTVMVLGFWMMVD